ncbi:hypothetical protein HYT00_03290 [Candidatus Giovannonibacteria bacterium]|nr:hypothetical protein [Candidatus Giovannonibacteria bacterium]
MLKLNKKIIFAGAVITPAGGPPNDWLSYAQFIYPFIISVAAVLAVIMLIVAGLEMMTASEGMRSDAKQKIQNALLGLLLAVGAYLILNTINPDLLKLKINTSGLRINVQGQSDSGGPNPTKNPAATYACISGFWGTPTGSCYTSISDCNKQCSGMLSGCGPAPKHCGIK